MLNGIDPIIIFLFYKKLPASATEKIPTSGLFNALSLPPIPIYLSEKLTGLYIDNEDKNIDIDTQQDTLAAGGIPNVNQKALNSIVKLNLLATKDSIGLNILISLADLILPLVTSKEYGITYLHGSTTIFNGLLHSFSTHVEANTNLINVTLELVNTSKKTATVLVDSTPSATLNNTGSAPSGGTAPPAGGGSVPVNLT